MTILKTVYYVHRYAHLLISKCSKPGASRGGFVPGTQTGVLTLDPVWGLGGPRLGTLGQFLGVTQIFDSLKCIFLI